MAAAIVTCILIALVVGAIAYWKVLLPRKREIRYYNAVEDFVKGHGFYTRLLELQGTDGEYCTASLRVYKAGYEAGKSHKVVGAFIMESIGSYSKDRRLGIYFLESIEGQLQQKR